MKKTILYNLIGILASAGILAFCYTAKGYRQAGQAVKNDYRFFQRNKNLTLEDRYASKLGGSYTFFRYVRDNTPEDAVIYLPSIHWFVEDVRSIRFHMWCMGAKLWATRFVYPRKIVTEQEYPLSAASQRLTHVIVVGDGGRNVLPYEIGNVGYIVLPSKGF